MGGIGKKPGRGHSRKLAQSRPDQKWQWLQRREGRPESGGGREERFEAKIEEIGRIDKQLDDCLNEVVMKVRYLETLEKPIEEREESVDFVSNELKMKELEEQTKE
ncbi:hypothetical protein ACLB2K_024203 [Fragaria x ananassa]